MRRFWVLLLWAPLAAAQVVPGEYIVELSGEPAAAYMAKSAGPAARRLGADRRAMIAAEQAEARRTVEALGAEVTGSVDTVANALFVRIPDERAGELASLPGVSWVTPVRLIQYHLDHALPLHKVPEAWTRAGGSGRAGAGMKIGIIDTGIDNEHPAFQDTSLTVPAGFPIVGSEADRAYTNNKIIVARSYRNLLGGVATAIARDVEGHGTGVAMAAAGLAVQAPLASISGVAPKAWLGNYNVSVGGRSFSSDYILKALDDAVKDGMDVVNFSGGDPVAPRPEGDRLALAVERAVAAGVLVVVAAGNEGPDPNTISSPATSPSAIAVGANWNGRIFVSGTVTLGSSPVFAAYPGSGPTPPAPVTAPLADVSALDQNGMACSAFPAQSLKGKIALILRGVCLFEDKLNNVQGAGAVAALVYTDADRPDPITMSVGAATLPAVMVSYSDGIEIKQRLGADPSLQATLRFTTSALPRSAQALASFSSRGPGPDQGVKPDLVAAGAEIYTATQKHNLSGELYDPSGYVVVDGTSFSSPIVAGAAAVLKAARPGLTAAQYRSLLINSASTLRPDAANVEMVQRTGTGILDLDAALQNTAVASPVSLSFGAGSVARQITRNLTIANVGTAADTFWITARPRRAGPVPALSADSLTLQPGESRSVTVTFDASGLAAPPRSRARQASQSAALPALAAGTYDGFLEIRGALAGTVSRVAYWYAQPSDKASFLTVLWAPESGAPGSEVQFYFRVTDASGVALLNQSPAVTAATAGASVRGVTSVDATTPGAYAAAVRLSLTPGSNTFRIEAGGLSKDVTILVSPR